MKYIKFFTLLVGLIVALSVTGCTGTSPGPADREAPQLMAETPVQETVDDSSSQAMDERFYYNIRILAPEELEKMQISLKPDEHLIKNEQGDLIGVVSPRSLFLRGDLVQLQQGEKREGREFGRTDISEHLVEIAFGLDNAKLGLFKTDKDYQFWFDAFYTQDDVKFALELAKYLNSLSDTTQFEDEEVALGFLKSNYATIPYNYYNIKIVPKKMLDDFKDRRKTGDHLLKKADGTLIGMIGSDFLYLIDTLSPEERQHYIRKGVLYSMGMHGVSYNERDSFFYREEGLNRELSELDTHAIKLLYGGRLKTGMDIEEVRKTLGLTS